MTAQGPSTDVAVIGGGLAGLAAATYTARSGRSVVLCERAPALGGRAATHAAGAFRLNLGPHALYRAGRAADVLRELGVSFRGGSPSPSGGFAVDRRVKHALPGGFLSLLTTGLFGLSAKLETARLLGSFAAIDPEPLHRVPVQEWIESAIRHPDVRRLVAALVRLSSYTDAPEQMSAGAAVAQLQMALGENVAYLDGGWQTLVDGLRAAAESAGVHILTSARAVAIEADGVRRHVRFANGDSVLADAVIVAGAPETAAALVSGSEGEALRRWAAAAIPVKAACLDLALSRLPMPRATFALGIDRPLYLSVHSAVAQLGPEGGAVIHVARYLGSEPGEAKADERELEELLDLIQPGWREVVVERRFLPSMVVAHWLPTAATGGTAGRPGPQMPGAAGLFVAGDWVGPEGLLADASLASAKRTAQLAASRSRPAAAA